MIFYGIVSTKTERVVEFFLERDAAEAITVEVRGDDPDLADVLCVEEVELEGPVVAELGRRPKPGR
jgi:hypothetical protein